MSNDQDKTHWKKLTNTNYLGSYALQPGKDLVVTITNVKKEMVKDATGSDSECLIVHLQNQKPLICNKTNAKAIAKATGSPFIEDWSGKQIALYIASVRAFGETVDGLRVRPTAVSETPTVKKKPLTNDEFKKLLEAIKSGKYTVEKAIDSFKFTEVQMNLLIQMPS
jgi:hypothetical protein